MHSYEERIPPFGMCLITGYRLERAGPARPAERLRLRARGEDHRSTLSISSIGCRSTLPIDAVDLVDRAGPPIDAVDRRISELPSGAHAHEHRLIHVRHHPVTGTGELNRRGR